MEDTGKFRWRLALCLTLTFLIFAPRNGFAGAWTQPQGQSQLITTLSYYHADSFYTANGQKTAIPDYRKFELNPYYEYGLREDVTLGVSATAQAVSQDSYLNESNIGIGDTELFVRKRIATGDNWVFSVQPLVKLPRATQAYDVSSPVVGSNQADIEGRAMFGGNFSLLGRLHYVDMGIAYRHRLSTPEDQVRADASVGFRVTDNLTVLGQIFHTENLGSLNAAGNIISAEQNYKVTKLQLSGIYDVNDQLAVQAGMFTDLQAKNTGSGTGGMTALWWKW